MTIVRIGEIAKLSPDTIKGYQALTAAGQEANLLGPKTRELISLAVAVTVRCDGYITWRLLKRLASLPPSMLVPPSSIPAACWTPTSR